MYPLQDVFFHFGHERIGRIDHFFNIAFAELGEELIGVERIEAIVPDSRQSDHDMQSERHLPLAGHCRPTSTR
jgi:hypothetical protein